MYQVDPPAVSLDTSGVTIPAQELPISKEHPTLTEVREVISKLKAGKAAGIYSIPAELLLASDEPIAQGLHCPGCQLTDRYHQHHCQGYQTRFSPTFFHDRSETIYLGTRDRSSLYLLLTSPQQTTSWRFELLWNVLVSLVMGCLQPTHCYTGVESVLQCGGVLSSFFPVNLRVRQDCILTQLQYMHGL